MCLGHGVPIGLGVDGSASNDSSSMLAEARQAMLVSRVKAGVSSMPARDALRLATRGGAQVLGRDDIGELAPGKAADIAIFDLNGIDFAGAWADPVAAVLFCGASHKARWVLVNGEVVVEERRLVRVNEELVARQANALSKDLLEKASQR
jgi:cytosine/adenosine deaminase-related metal-dependent hydrolase